MSTNIWGEARRRTDCADRNAMTLVEMAVVVLMTGVFLFLLAGWMKSVREGAKQDLAVEMLARLDQALARYHRSTGDYPPLPPFDSGLSVPAELLHHEKTQKELKELPASLWRDQTLVDPWGTPLRYLPANADSPYVRANNDNPIFLSAGPDRDFGDIDPAFIGDNLRSDDPRQDAFIPRFLSRESEDERETPNGETNDR